MPSRGIRYFDGSDFDFYFGHIHILIGNRQSINKATEKREIKSKPNEVKNNQKNRSALDACVCVREI